MMLKLMFKQLKIPIWYRFDTTLDKEELFKIITEVEESGYHVKTVTCDQGPKNRGLATKLGIMVRGGIFRCYGPSQHVKNKYGEGFEVEIKIKKPSYDELKSLARDLLEDAQSQDQEVDIQEKMTLE